MLEEGLNTEEGRPENGQPAIGAMEPVRVEPGEPQWIERAFNVKAGLDPLGLQTITIDRIMPRLVPSILGLTRRARYFAFYAYLLSEYQRRRMEASNDGLSAFIKMHEYEYALAVLSCPRQCTQSMGGPIGSQRASPAIGSGHDPLERGESVESRLGGYGLYYRTPMAELGVAVRSGELLGEQPIPVDILSTGSRATALAESFRQGLSKTQYGAQYAHGVDPIPSSVLIDYASSMCLCNLGESEDERSQLRDILLGNRQDLPPRETDQRRRSFAFVLQLMDGDPSLAVSESSMRAAIWEHFLQHISDETAVARTAAQWAGLLAKDVMQDALSSIWKDVCSIGLSSQPEDGLSPAALDDILTRHLAGSSPLDFPGHAVSFDADSKTNDFATKVVAAADNLALESVRQWANSEARAIAGLALLTVLFSRLNDIDDPPAEWLEIASQRSERQPSVLQLRIAFEEHLGDDPTIGETLAWLAKRSVIAPHEVIAYSKLPDFTFRFRWENGRLRFYPQDHDRFGVTDIRRDSILMISRDLGYWNLDGEAGQLTEDGQAFVSEVFD